MRCIWVEIIALDLPAIELEFLGSNSWAQCSSCEFINKAIMCHKSCVCAPTFGHCEMVHRQRMYHSLRLYVPTRQIYHQSNPILFREQQYHAPRNMYMRERWYGALNVYQSIKFKLHSSLWRQKIDPTTHALLGASLMRNARNRQMILLMEINCARQYRIALIRCYSMQAITIRTINK